MREEYLEFIARLLAEAQVQVRHARLHDVHAQGLSLPAQGCTSGDEERSEMLDVASQLLCVLRNSGYRAYLNGRVRPLKLVERLQIQQRLSPGGGILDRNRFPNRGVERLGLGKNLGANSLPLLALLGLIDLLDGPERVHSHPGANDKIPLVAGQQSAELKGCSNRWMTYRSDSKSSPNRTWLSRSYPWYVDT